MTSGDFVHPRGRSSAGRVKCRPPRSRSLLSGAMMISWPPVLLLLLTGLLRSAAVSNVVRVTPCVDEIGLVDSVFETLGFPSANAGDHVTVNGVTFLRAPAVGNAFEFSDEPTIIVTSDETLTRCPLLQKGVVKPQRWGVIFKSSPTCSNSPPAQHFFSEEAAFAFGTHWEEPLAAGTSPRKTKLVTEPWFVPGWLRNAHLTASAGELSSRPILAYYYSGSPEYERTCRTCQSMKDHIALLPPAMKARIVMDQSDHSVHGALKAPAASAIRGIKADDILKDVLVNADLNSDTGQGLEPTMRLDLTTYAKGMRNAVFTLCPVHEAMETACVWDAIRSGSIPIVDSGYTQPTRKQHDSKARQQPSEADDAVYGLPHNAWDVAEVHSVANPQTFKTSLRAEHHSHHSQCTSPMSLLHKARAPLVELADVSWSTLEDVLKTVGSEKGKALLAKSMPTNAFLNRFEGQMRNALVKASLMLLAPVLPQ